MHYIANPLKKRRDASKASVVFLVVRQVRHALATGLIRPGEKLPSQRKVAQSLVINHLTVKKAYETLKQAWDKK